MIGPPPSDRAEIVSAGIGGLALIVSLAVTFRAWKDSKTSIRYTARNQYMNALFDLDRQLIERPELWAVYDKHPMATRRSQKPKDTARREAFIYYHLSLFETVFNDYRRVLRRSFIDKQFWRTWDEWIRAFFLGSSEARQLFRGASQTIYHPDFVAYVNRIINPDEQRRSTGSIWRRFTAIARLKRTVFARRVTLTGEALTVGLADGRTVTAPLAWYPRLLNGTPAERSNWRLIGRGEGIYWPDLDEDVSVEGLILGRPSGESQRSFQRWLEERQQSV